MPELVCVTGEFSPLQRNEKKETMIPICTGPVSLVLCWGLWLLYGLSSQVCIKMLACSYESLLDVLNLFGCLRSLDVYD